MKKCKKCPKYKKDCSLLDAHHCRDEIYDKIEDSNNRKLIINVIETILDEEK